MKKNLAMYINYTDGKNYIEKIVEDGNTVTEFDKEIQRIDLSKANHLVGEVISVYVNGNLKTITTITGMNFIDGVPAIVLKADSDILFGGEK